MKTRNFLFALIAFSLFSISISSCETTEPVEDMTMELDVVATDGDGDPDHDSPGGAIAGNN